MHPIIYDLSQVGMPPIIYILFISQQKQFAVGG